MLYGKTATDAALASQGEGEDRLLSPSARGMERIPELTRDFFESSFFRRFQIQREFARGAFPELHALTPSQDQFWTLSSSSAGTSLSPSLAQRRWDPKAQSSATRCMPGASLTAWMREDSSM